MPDSLEISLLGELRITSSGTQIALPSSRKARSLLGFLVATGRPHRRERLCELFWDAPEDPKASLRWALSKLRKVVDTNASTRISADRERVQFDTAGIAVDISNVHQRLRDPGHTSITELEEMARRLEAVFLEGLDGAGDEAFDAWLSAEREDIRIARIAVYRKLLCHRDSTPLSAQKGYKEDASGAELHERRAKAAAKSDGHNTVAGGNPQTVDESTLKIEIQDTPEAQQRRVAAAKANILRRQRIGFCEVKDGTKIAYASVGSGPPILKAANWLNHLELDWGSPIWGKSFAELAREYTFVRYDERGCGLSDWDVADLSFDAFVEDLEVVADALGLERFPLIGISQGAAVSIEYAVRHPERVSSLILIGAYASGWRHHASPEEQERRKAVMTLTELGWGTDNPAYRHIFSQTFMPEAKAEELAWFDDFQRQTTSPRNAVRFQEAFGDIDVRDKLAQVTTPTLVLHSRYDQRIPLELGQAVASGIPGARFVPLESSNHILLGNEPAWRHCVEAVKLFLDEIAE